MCLASHKGTSRASRKINTKNEYETYRALQKKETKKNSHKLEMNDKNIKQTSTSK